MKDCHWFYNKRDCPYGDRCFFRHDCDQREQKFDGFLGESVVYGGDDSKRSEEYARVNPGENYDRRNFFKTKLCVTWDRFGECSYGVKCTYAHGEAELKQGSHYASKKVFASESNSTAAKFHIGTGNAHKVQGKSLHFMNWSSQKIGRIYGDWIDTSEDVKD